MRLQKAFAFLFVCSGILASIAVDRMHGQNHSQWFHISQIGTRAQLSDQPGDLMQTTKRLFAKENPITMIDSVLSIAQNYYVDAGRVSLKHLFVLATNYVRDEENVTVVTKGDTTLLQKGKKSLSFKAGEQMTYRELVANLVAVVRFIESTEDKKPDANKPDRDFQLAAKAAPVLNKEEGDGTSVKAPQTAAFRVLNGILNQLDPHSNILDTDAYNELMQGTEGVFGGLGVVVGIRGQVLTVIKPIPNSPASRAGVKKNDRILKIGAVDTFGYSLDELVDHMRGAPGTSVNLVVLKDGAQAPTDLKLTREVIQVQTVDAKTITTPKGEYLHVLIDSFASRTSTELASAIKSAMKKAKTRLGGVVLDLRSNPGGLLDQAVEVADLFLQDGVIVTTKGRREEVEKATAGFNEFSMPLIVLMNSESASASEIVAGALQDNKRAVVIGQPSFGKGSVQTIFKLPREQALKLTIARHYTPNGGSIQNVGIMPQIWLQPMVQGDNNENLLGDYRYRSERFLNNHLEMSAEERQIQESFVRNVQYKAFYLTKPADAAVEDKADHELRLATKILDEVSRVYGDKPPEGKYRADHILALTTKTVMKELEEDENQVEQYVKKSFQVDWTHDGVKYDLQKPLVSIEIPDRIDLDGKERQLIPVKIKNVGAKPVERLSFFVKPKPQSAGTYEQLVGNLDAGQEWKGAVPLTILRGLKEKSFEAETGVAVDAMPIPGLVKKVTISVSQKPDPVMAINASYIDSSKKTHLGFIEAKEEGRLRLTITNQGNRSVTKLKVQMYNLSGSQVKCDERAVSIPEIAPGKESEIEFKLVAGDNLSRTLEFGFSVQSQELVEKRRIRLTVPTIPNQIQVAKEIKP